MKELVHPKPGDILFISDVHLEGYTTDINKSIEQDLISLVEYATEYQLQIIIVGDLFDYWMEYRGKYPSFAENVLRAFQKQNEFIPTLYITGNHDNWTGPKLVETGFDLENEFRTIELEGKKCMLLHGDGLKDKSMNLPRPKLDRLIRSRFFLFFYQLFFPPKVGLSIMSWFSKRSKKRDKGQENNSKRMDRWALQKLENPEIDVLICGHFHVHRFISNTNGLYINLGTFYKHRTVGLYTKSTFQLVTWNAHEKAFICFEL